MHRNKILSTIAAVLMLGLTFNLFAQVVNIPDPALDGLIRQKLRILSDRPITQDDMLNLRGDFSADGNIGITDITGLEYATNLTALSFYHNPISDISPMSGMTSLRGFNLWGCQIEDLSPLRHLPNLEGGILGANRISNLEPLTGLTNITFLNMDSNRISDISPLSTLHNLIRIELHGNQIVDYSPLANLINLEVLWIHNNPGDDFSPLNALGLTEFRYDQKCDFPQEPPSIEERLKTRSMPSIFQAWDNSSEPTTLTSNQRNELHDLHWSQSFNLGWDTTIFKPTYGLATSIAGSLDDARKLREEKLSRNPNMIFLVEIRMREHLNEAAFPPDSPFWFRNTDGSIAQFGPSFWFNFLLPEVQQLLVERILAIEKCGVYDGVFLDQFARDGTDFPHEFGLPYNPSRAEIMQVWENVFEVVRARTRDDFLIVINANDTRPFRLAKYVNGVFMESFKDHPGGYTRDWVKKLESVLTWAENNLREPRINCLEGEGMSIEPPDGPNNRRWMRMFTTLSLTHSDGYVLYTDGVRDFVTQEDPLGLPHHQHIWYDFWDADLGQPVGPKAQPYKDTEGVFIREFTNGWAVYNRSGKAQVVEFSENVSSVTSGLSVAKHAVPDLDGDMFLRVKPKNPADVNRDGVVNILDLTLVVQAFGTDKPEADVNGDGIVNVFDLVFVANQF